MRNQTCRIRVRTILPETESREPIVSLVTEPVFLQDAFCSRAKMENESSKIPGSRAAVGRILHGLRRSERHTPAFGTQKNSFPRMWVICTLMGNDSVKCDLIPHNIART